MGKYSKKRNKTKKKSHKHKTVKYSAYQQLKPKHKSRRRAYYMSGGADNDQIKPIPTISPGANLKPTVSLNSNTVSPGAILKPTVSLNSNTVSPGAILKPTVSLNSNIIPTVSSPDNKIIPTVSPDANLDPKISSDKTIIPTVSDKAQINTIIPTVSPDANLDPKISSDNTIIPTISPVDSKISSDIHDLKPTPKNPLVALTELTKGSCNSAFYNDLIFIIDDFNGVLAELLPVLDDDSVEKIIQFIKVFNEKFETNPAFREEFERGIANMTNVVKDVGNKAVGSGSALVIQILTNMVHAIPGVGAVVSILKAANNLSDSLNDVTSSTKKAATEWKRFMENMENLTNVSNIKEAIETGTINNNKLEMANDKMEKENDKIKKEKETVSNENNKKND